MKFNTFSILTLGALLTAAPIALALPEPVAAAPPPEQSLPVYHLVERRQEKRSIPATVLLDGLQYRECPRSTSDCPVLGQYANGTHIELLCYTRDNTTVVEGDAGWANVTTTGDWLPLANGKYVSWTVPLPAC